MKRVLRSQADFKSTLMRNQLTSLILHESITTTKAKSKNLIPYVNRFFARVKISDLNAKKLAHQTLFDKAAIVKTFDDVVKRTSKIGESYTKSFNLEARRGDSSPMVRVSLIDASKPETAKAETKKVAKKK
ncbi:hypothetical protein HY844_01045 [Candidatus Berkelbacteria bacterium]|nr:hypothetical protein [Candidatus Berkelbacteria bacterium]